VGDRVSGFTIGEIREAVASQIKQTVSHDIAAHPYWRRDLTAGGLPCVIVIPGTVTYFDTFGATGLGDINLELLVCAAASDDTSAQRTLDQMLSYGGSNNYSVIAALIADRTLGGAVSDCTPLTATYAAPPAEPGGIWTATVPLRIFLRKEA